MYISISSHNSELLSLVPAVMMSLEHETLRRSDGYIFKPLNDPREHSLKRTGKSLSDFVKPIEIGIYSINLSQNKNNINKDKKKGSPENRITAKAIPPRYPLRRQKCKTIAFSNDQDKVVVEVKVILKCLSRAVWYEIKSNVHDHGTVVDVFTDESYTSLPPMSIVENFFTQIFRCKDLSTECAVTAGAYIDKLKTISGVKLTPSNWRRICFIAVLEADKVLRDKLVWNEDYKDIHLGIDVNLLRKLERAFLRYIEFSLTLTQADYTMYLLELLSLREKQEPENKGKRLLALYGKRLRSSSGCIERYT
jgi:hypothetical protein